MGIDVENYLFTNYINGPRGNTKGPHISSHWQNLLSKGEVIYENGNIKKLSGFGIGRIKSRSILKTVPDWMLILLHLLFISNRLDVIKLFPTAIRVCKRLELSFNYAAFTQICAVSVISGYADLNKRAHIINIGDGNGLLSTMLKTLYPHAKIYLVDFGQILLFQSHHLQKLFPLSMHLLSKDIKKHYDMENVDAFVYCPTEDLEDLADMTFDIGINISSMQEMNHRERERFFSFLRNHLDRKGIFYCSNRIEKIMRGGEISKFMDYPWVKNDIHLLNERNNAYRITYSLKHWRNFNGPRIFGFRVPFLTYFEPIWHRVSILSTG